MKLRCCCCNELVVGERIALVTTKDDTDRVYVMRIEHIARIAGVSHVLFVEPCGFKPTLTVQ